MSIFLNADSKVIVQGITGGEGTKHTALMLKAGTQVVGGVNARKAGLPAYAILYKPFRLDQLLSAVERIIEAPGPVPQASGN